MKRSLAFSVLLLAGMFGCHSDNHTALSPLFTPDTDKAQIDAFANAQAAAAAHEDSTLFAADFTGDHLNSLGTAKLDSIRSGCEHSSMMQIYLVEVADTPEHRQAITKYLLHHGCKSEQFAVVGGANPDSYTMAGDSLKELDAMNGASTPSTDSGTGGAGSMTAGIGGK